MTKQYTWLFLIIIFIAIVSNLPILTKGDSKLIKSPNQDILNDKIPIQVDEGSYIDPVIETDGGDSNVQISSFGKNIRDLNCGYFGTSSFDCKLIKEIKDIHLFLMKNKNGLPYTNDPRNLTPVSEVVRLNIISQAQGYLNIYKYTNNRVYLNEANLRLNYIINSGSNALANSPYDGMVGYTFLYAYELTNNQSYLNYGLHIADNCFKYKNKFEDIRLDLVLNWGYMCGMNLAKAYKITNKTEYLSLVRNITRETLAYQYNDGSFPHQAYVGSNTHYTNWIANEMIHVREDDKNNPDIDISLIRTMAFLVKRVNPNGSLNYEDANGTYYYDASKTSDTRGWNNGLSGMIYVLKVFGEDKKADIILKFLIKQELNGINKGSYPDKWGYYEPNNTWANGNPSIIRTSAIFADLTNVLVIDKSCKNGKVTSCNISVNNCNSAFKELDGCTLNLTGQNICYNGRFTQCFNKNLITYRLDNTYCLPIFMCRVDDIDRGEGLLNVCTYTGTRKCIVGYDKCTECFNPSSVSCNTADPLELCNIY
jgi:hypothetical protein